MFLYHSVPDEVVNMKKLERIDLTNNDVSGYVYCVGAVNEA